MSGKAKTVPSSKPLPPFGRELYEARKRNESPNVWVFAGEHSWKRAQGRRPPEVLCLPPDEPADAYDWSVCRGLAITLIVWGRDETFMDSLARLLVISGATLVAALSPEGSTFYRPRS